MTDEAKINLFKEIRSDISKYIVKPQKEGGGNNYYNEDILLLLPENDDVSKIGSILQESIIMERINMPEFMAPVLFENKLKVVKCVSEVSVYGSIISDKTQIYLNKTFGVLLRTKEAHVQEGGLAAGFSAIDFPYLVDLKCDKDNYITLSEY